MQAVLGIDTGGTYTDAVVIDASAQRVVAKGKARTTREDLAVGIRNSIESLQYCEDNPSEALGDETGVFNGLLANIRLVALSTTLATNAIVEGKGGEVGLLLLGHGIDVPVPASHVVRVAGGHDVKGNAISRLDIEEVRQALAKMRGKVDALAISGYLSVRNPEHELIASSEAKELLGVPVVCAHQLTTTLGFYERTVTAVLNARLLPIIARLLDSVREVLNNYRITAPLMVVKGDGSLMSESQARERPVETILSGPAASVIGATFLTKEKNAIVVDVGGTTTDVACLDGGKPKLNPEGAMVGGWLTRVNAARISTFAIGCDSVLSVEDGKLNIGPQRVLPICVASHCYPHLVDELVYVLNGSDKQKEILFGQPCDCYILLQTPRNNSISPVEKHIVEFLQSAPRSAAQIASMIGNDCSLLSIRELVDKEIVARASLTPTDLLHVQGLFCEWDTKAAEIASEILALRLNMRMKEFVSYALREVERKIASAILQSLLNDSGYRVNLEEECAHRPFVDRILGRTAEQFECTVKLDKPLVAIGAPVRCLMPKVATLLNADLRIPQHAEVANAVGAATGRVTEQFTVIIRPSPKGGFIVHAPWERMIFQTLAEAVSYAEVQGRDRAVRRAKQAGADEVDVTIERKDIYGTTQVQGEKDLFIETIIKIAAVGGPRWAERS